MSRGAILVTGGAGYIGSHVVQALLTDGWRPTILDDLSTGRHDAAPAGIPLVQGDVGDGTLLDAVLAEVAPRVVLHFAGSTSAPGSVAEPLLYYENNTAKSLRLVQAMLSAASRPALLFSSSAAVYGAADTARVDEDAPTRPLNPYGLSKLMTEQMLADAARAHGLRYLALRYFNVAGAGRRARSGARAGAPGSLLAVMLEAVRGERDHVPIYGLDHPTRDGTGVRDYIHVEDLAAAHIAALPLLQAEDAPRVLNCGYGRGWSVLEVLDAVEQASGVRLRRRDVGRRPGDPSEVVADASRLLRHTSWRPQRDDLARIVGDALAAQVNPRPLALAAGSRLVDGMLDPDPDGRSTPKGELR
ncbi:UDP-glucose 4-epimerase GalE [Caulobacter sp. S45]|uniref:UDP-glucose 4-epimerase GalE n=1 Tax=Caulobacter sp. S45 TaxID=1641861 RepID=UPI0015774BC5|nr:UDP-glucose 4-epimerase GalE [Caulobacter sp. S45]